jgi:hypothetical protein
MRSDAGSYEKWVVKLSYPSRWDVDWGGPMVLKESPLKSGIWENCVFEVNTTASACDFWIVYEDINQYLFETSDCPRENTILVTGEEKTMWDYPPEYLAQFGYIYTSRDDIRHPRVLRGPYLCPWHVKRDYDTLNSSPPPEKSKDLSVICSDAILLEGHKKRFAFVNRIKGHFKDRLHWYGRGEEVLNDKWDGLGQYKYSVAIENAAHPGYFTEKLNDCFLAYTMPFYWGCPDLEKYFPEGSFARIDINDFQASIRAIDQAIEEDHYAKHYDAIVAARNLVLNAYQFFPALTELVNQLVVNSQPAKRSGSIIRSKSYFSADFTLKQKLYKIKRSVELRLKGYQ